MWIYLLLVVGLTAADVPHRRAIRQAADGRKLYIKPDAIWITEFPERTQTADTLYLTPTNAYIIYNMLKLSNNANKFQGYGFTWDMIGKPSCVLSNDFQKCGKSLKIDNKVVGGRNATLGDWPWMVALGYSHKDYPVPEFKCGATLISNKWVITAAHCIRSFGILELTTARLGDLDLNPNAVDHATPIDVEIDQIIIHPEYTHSTNVNDIALLRLKDTIEFSPYIRPICVLGSEYARDAYYEYKRPFIIGWGAVEWLGPESSMLQETTLTVINNTRCADIYARSPSVEIDERVLCAGERGKDTCQGDSGGPLIFSTTDSDGLSVYSLGGIVSFGVRCADLIYPGVYTRVATFSDWIREKTGLNI